MPDPTLQLGDRRTPADPLIHRIVDTSVFVLYGDILQIGCGTGALLRDIAERWPVPNPNTRRHFGQDQPQRVVQARASSQGHDISYVEGTAEALPFEAQSFKTVFATCVIQDWAHRPTCRTEVARVLEPGGCFIVAGKRRSETASLTGQAFGDEMAPADLHVHNSIELGHDGFFSYGRKP